MEQRESHSNQIWLQPAFSPITTHVLLTGPVAASPFCSSSWSKMIKALPLRFLIQEEAGPLLSHISSKGKAAQVVWSRLGFTGILTHSFWCEDHTVQILFIKTFLQTSALVITKPIFEIGFIAIIFKNVKESVLCCILTYSPKETAVSQLPFLKNPSPPLLLGNVSLKTGIAKQAILGKLKNIIFCSVFIWWWISRLLQESEATIMRPAELQGQWKCQ